MRLSRRLALAAVLAAVAAAALLAFAGLDRKLTVRNDTSQPFAVHIGILGHNSDLDVVVPPHVTRVIPLPRPGASDDTRGWTVLGAIENTKSGRGVNLWVSADGSDRFPSGQLGWSPAERSAAGVDQLVAVYPCGTVTFWSALFEPSEIRREFVDTPFCKQGRAILHGTRCALA